MGIRFKKSISIGNLVKLNVSKSGISATVGKKGASINLGKNGTYLNLNPSLVGIKGTGLSYRQKLAGGYGAALAGIAGTKLVKDKKAKKEAQTATVDTSVVDEYKVNAEASFNINKDAPKVLNKNEFIEKLNSLDSESSKTIMNLSIDGDEDTIEALIGSLMANLDLAYEAKANYELEDHDLYVDLDLPEIEDLPSEYPCLVNNKVVYKNKTQNELNKEYSQLVLSLGVYLSAQFFNQSSYIEKIIISAFTSRRDSKGDLKDTYLYSVKYTRDIFEKTDLTKIEDLYKFILQFENRINMSTSSFAFKAIEPYTLNQTEETSESVSDIVKDALAGLKELGYKKETLDLIKDKLKDQEFKTSGEYLKEALKLLSSK